MVGYASVDLLDVRQGGLLVAVAKVDGGASEQGLNVLRLERKCAVVCLQRAARVPTRTPDLPEYVPPGDAVGREPHCTGRGCRRPGELFACEEDTRLANQRGRISRGEAGRLHEAGLRVLELLQGEERIARQDEQPHAVSFSGAWAPRLVKDLLILAPEQVGRNQRYPHEMLVGTRLARQEQFLHGRCRTARLELGAAQQNAGREVAGLFGKQILQVDDGSLDLTCFQARARVFVEVDLYAELILLLDGGLDTCRGESPDEGCEDHGTGREPRTRRRMHRHKIPELARGVSARPRVRNEPNTSSWMLPFRATSEVEDVLGVASWPRGFGETVRRVGAPPVIQIARTMASESGHTGSIRLQPGAPRKNFRNQELLSWCTARRCRNSLHRPNSASWVRVSRASGPESVTSIRTDG